MKAAGIPSYRALATQAGVSRWQIQQLRSGNIHTMRVVTLSQIAKALALDLPHLLQVFSTGTGLVDAHEQENKQGKSPPDQITTEITTEQLKSDALQTIETWLIQWPTIAKRAQEKGDAIAAAKLLPFVRPIEALMREWGVEPIAAVDEHVPYDPQYHQLTDGAANPGERVRVTHTGHTYNGKLLHKVKVKPIA